MSLERRTTTTIEVEDNGVIFVKTTTEIVEGGEVVAPAQHHRQPFDPGKQLVSDLPRGRAQRIAQAEWTPEVVRARKAELAGRR